MDMAVPDSNIENCKRALEDIFPCGYNAFVHSFGCQQNVSDGEHICGILSQLGFSFCQDEKEADMVIYNTCAVRETAETRVLGHIGNLKNIKQQKKNMLIAVCGCMTQREEIREKIKISYPFVDIVFGTNNISLLPYFILKRIKEQKRIFHSEMGTRVEENIPVIREDKIKAWLPIMQGCNNFCSYCIVPYVKGREMSRSPQKIVEEARELIGKGYKDITLLGQNVNSYGKGESVDFPGLLKQIDAIEGDFFLRFMTSHPKDCTFSLIDTIAQSRHICHNIHLPVQSGSNEILKKMNRNYTVEKYMALIDYAKEKIKDVSFSSDIIVGFPNETDEDFEKTLKLIEKVRFSALFTFIYSKRSGTPAALMEDTISYKEKTVRMNRLLKIQQNISEELNSEKIDSVVKVLFDSYSKEKREAVGRDEGNIIVVAKSDEDISGKFADVKINQAMSAQIKGDIDKIY